jgi:hypothetical protein
MGTSDTLYSHATYQNCNTFRHSRIMSRHKGSIGISKAQLAERLAVVEEMAIRRRMTGVAIARALVVQWAPTSERQIRRYVEMVLDAYRKSAEESAADRRMIFREMLISDHSRALDAGDFRAVASIDLLMARVDGLLVDQVEHRGAVAHLHAVVPGALTAAEEVRLLTDEDMDALDAIDRRLIAARSGIPEIGAPPVLARGADPDTGD